MNDRQLEKKIQQDTADIRRDLNSLMENSSSKISKGFEKRKYGKKNISDYAR